MIKTPKLRFKEFSGDWEEKKLGDYLIQYTEVTNINNQYPVLTSSRKGIFLQEEYFNRQIASKDNMGYNIVPRNYFTYRHMSDDSIFYFNINNIVDYGIVSILYPVFTTKNNFLNSYYLKNYLNESNRFRNYSLLQKQGGSRTYMYYSKLKEFKMPTPQIEEQEKIASFFSLIDDKISLQGEKVEALKDYKNGIMQKIFSRELRFKDDDGRDYPEWEAKKLGELGDTYNGLNGKTKENFGIGNGKYIVYKNVFGNTIAKEEEVDLVEINKGEKQNKVIKGDLLFTTSSETPEEVGMISCWNYDVDDLYLNSFCFGYRLFDLDGCSSIFMAYALRSEAYRRKISILGQGSTRYNISKTELMKMKVYIPFIDEQKKIVSLLLDLENKIEKEKEKLDYLNEYKKGLLRQMFV